MSASRRPGLLWEILAIVALISLLGAAGFWFFERDAHLLPDSPRSLALSFVDCVWWALVTVTTIGYGDIYPITAGGRAIALVLMFGGIGALGVSTAAIAAYFVRSDEIRGWKWRNLHGHVIICGGGTQGLALARAFAADNYPVVVIEREAETVRASLPETIFWLRGDATQSETLGRARLESARAVITVCGDDGTHAVIAAHCRELCGQSPVATSAQAAPLLCALHIVEPELWLLLRRHELSLNARENVGARGVQLQFFNRGDLAAHALLDSLLDRLPQNKVQPGAHLLVVGGQNIGAHVVAYAARHAANWGESESQNGANHDRVHITFVDPQATRWLQWLQLRHENSGEYCELKAIDLAPNDPRWLRGDWRQDAPQEITAALICLPDEAQSLATALALRHHVARGVPIVARMEAADGLSSLLQGEADISAASLDVRIYQPQRVLGGITEMLARALHDAYRRQLSDTERASNPNAVAWENLGEDARQSNRDQAADISRRLHQIGCDIAPLSGRQSAFQAFSDEEIETLSRLEHERWKEDRLRAGWRVGPRADGQKFNPNLLDWEDLPLQTQEFNRQSAQQLPAFLSRVGLMIYRPQTS